MTIHVCITIKTACGARDCEYVQELISTRLEQREGFGEAPTHSKCQGRVCVQKLQVYESLTGLSIIQAFIWLTHTPSLSVQFAISRCEGWSGLVCIRALRSQFVNTLGNID